MRPLSSDVTARPTPRPPRGLPPSPGPPPQLSTLPICCPGRLSKRGGHRSQCKGPHRTAGRDPRHEGAKHLYPSLHMVCSKEAHEARTSGTKVTTCAPGHQAVGDGHGDLWQPGAAPGPQGHASLTTRPKTRDPKPKPLMGPSPVPRPPSLLRTYPFSTTLRSP